MVVIPGNRAAVLGVITAFSSGKRFDEPKPLPTFPLACVIAMSSS